MDKLAGQVNSNKAGIFLAQMRKQVAQLKNTAAQIEETTARLAYAEREGLIYPTVIFEDDLIGQGAEFANRSVF